MSGESRYLSVVLFFIVQTINYNLKKKKKKGREGDKERRGRHAKQKRKVWAQSTVTKTEMWGRKSASEYNGSGGPHHHSFCESQKKKPNQTKTPNLSLSPAPATPPKLPYLNRFLSSRRSNSKWVPFIFG